jgi:hypothetical protein
VSIDGNCVYTGVSSVRFEEFNEEGPVLIFDKDEESDAEDAAAAALDVNMSLVIR